MTRINAFHDSALRSILRRDYSQSNSSTPQGQTENSLKDGLEKASREHSEISLKDESLLLFTVAVGEQYRKQQASILQDQACYAYHHNMIRGIDTRKMHVIYDALQLSENDVGPYYGNNEWYMNHGWRWAWTKAFSLLSLLETGEGFDWVVYMDPDCEVLNPEFDFKSLLKHAKHLAEQSGYSWDAYHAILSQTSPGRKDISSRVGGPTNNDIIILRRSKEAIRFLRKWVSHRDCECWVDQGAFYIETIRWIRDYLHRHNISIKGRTVEEIAEGGKACDERFSEESKKKAIEFLKSQTCFDEHVRRMKRRCTWTTPGPMTCSCNFIECSISAFKRFGFTLFDPSENGDKEEPKKYNNNTRYNTPTDERRIHIPPPVMTISELDSSQAPFLMFGRHGNASAVSEECRAKLPMNAHDEPESETRAFWTQNATIHRQGVPDSQTNLRADSSEVSQLSESMADTSIIRKVKANGVHFLVI
eukprot:CAMPEP_0114509834 /NCGR_PEP_ID=MMETSP0109-20121206/13437_1 /TAXON_ID=29199 /ORGANISM="Chlorarachnion reptans, Strain CCCM449" /LENGTH=475 /DNA_ID=CAMNT_0001689045 /DNA_START=282 /DNA_END=1709 /DNA_ORIENTATION=-